MMPPGGMTGVSCQIWHFVGSCGHAASKIKCTHNIFLSVLAQHHDDGSTRGRWVRLALHRLNQVYR